MENVCPQAAHVALALRFRTSMSSLPHAGQFDTFKQGSRDPDTMSKTPRQLPRWYPSIVSRIVALSESVLISPLLIMKIIGMSRNSEFQISSSNGWTREPAPLITYQTT